MKSKEKETIMRLLPSSQREGMTVWPSGNEKWSDPGCILKRSGKDC